MTALNNQDSDLEKLCSVAIEQRLGDISGLPKDLVEHVLNSYRKFIASYLNMLRQKENKPANWMPKVLHIDTELADGMRHFFSDYQHITREFYRLNQKMDRLQEIDKDSQLKLYRHAIDDILKPQSLD
ncbi:MAG: hypothetical protein KJO34_07535 [Deltaproteobacteria bacterium]|nr:hypothetical protein [Deltaproteobacteria bacterium]